MAFVQADKSWFWHHVQEGHCGPECVCYITLTIVLSVSSTVQTGSDAQQHRSNG